MRNPRYLSTNWLALVLYAASLNVGLLLTDQGVDAALGWVSGVLFCGAYLCHQAVERRRED